MVSLGFYSNGIQFFLRMYLFCRRFFSHFQSKQVSLRSLIFHSIAIVNISNNGTRAFLAKYSEYRMNERTTENSAFLK